MLLVALFFKTKSKIATNPLPWHLSRRLASCFYLTEEDKHVGSDVSMITVQLIH